MDYLEEKYHFLELFKNGIFSHLAKVKKPEPRIYQLILEKTRSAPEECVYIDDKAEFLLPAKALRMEAVLFYSPEQLTNELHRLELQF